MEFQNTNGIAEKEAAAKEINNIAANGAGKSNANGSNGKTANGNPKPETKEAKPVKDEKGEVKAEASKKEEAKPEENQPAGEAKPEAEKAEDNKPAKPDLTLEAKIKAVNDLHRKTIQRLALIARIQLLENFEVKLAEENDELEGNPYQGCKLIIEDDKRRQFVTNTPGLIRMVAQFIFDACEAKLAEIESNINFPQA